MSLYKSKEAELLAAAWEKTVKHGWCPMLYSNDRWDQFVPRSEATRFSLRGALLVVSKETFAGPITRTVLEKLDEAVREVYPRWRSLEYLESTVLTTQASYEKVLRPIVRKVIRMLEKNNNVGR